jgi:hypothetical protein
MTVYSIVKIGSDFVVQADNQSIMKFASRRMAVRAVAEASDLLAVSLTPSDAPEQPALAPSIARDSSELA